MPPSCPIDGKVKAEEIRNGPGEVATKILADLATGASWRRCDLAWVGV